MATSSVTYVPRPMPTLGGDSLYLQQELANISQSIKTIVAQNETPWIPYTPAVTPDGGTLGSVSATGRYKKIGKTVFIQLNVHITSVGTATGYLNVFLPVNTAGPCVIAGWENQSSGKMMQGNAYGSQSYLDVRDYANGSPIVANYNILLGGVYEAA